MTQNNFTCTAELYTGEVCHGALANIQNCLGINGDEILISSSRDQKELEERVILITNTTCVEEKEKEVICLSIFGLCDNTTNQLYLPSADECRAVGSKVCASGSAMTENTSESGVLLDCESLPETSYECTHEGMLALYLCSNFAMLANCTLHGSLTLTFPK